MSAVMEEPVVISREEARARGLKNYFTGKPCIYGHADERLVANANCITCNRLNSDAFNRGQRREPPAPTVISRGDARAQGQSKYFIGEPCLRGHLAYRRVRTNQCCECQRLSQRGALPPRDKPAARNLANGGFTHDPPYWSDDGGAKRVPIYDHNFHPPRLVRRVGWTNCLGREPVHRIFSYDVARERICTSCKAMQGRGTIND